MKKNALSILVLFIVLTFMFGLVGCQKLKVDNLKANYHLNKANQNYKDEKYRNAIKEYEIALELNPDLKVVYLYLGTSYSQIFRPMKDDDRNKTYGENAVKYLLKAYEEFPDNENAVTALGDIYDKLGDYDEAAKYYLKILERDPDNPKSYYILADFYSKYNKTDEAESMYQKRIELDPRNPEGYHYFAGYMQNRNQWDRAIEYHEKRLYALIDSDVVILKNEVDKMKNEIKQIDDITNYIENTLKKHKTLPKEEKQRLMDEANEKLAKFQPKEELEKQVEEKEAQIKEKIAGFEEKINAGDDELKKKAVEAYYTIGVVCWTKSYRTPPNMMAADERTKLLDYGLENLDVVLNIQKENDMALSFKALIYLQKIVAEPLKNTEYRAKWKEYFDLAKDIRTKRLKRERLKEQLEKMGTVD